MGSLNASGPSKWSGVARWAGSKRTSDIQVVPSAVAYVARSFVMRVVWMDGPPRSAKLSGLAEVRGFGVWGRAGQLFHVMVVDCNDEVVNA